MNWTPERAERWAAERERGRHRFVLVHGVVRWGVVMFVVMTPVFHFIGAGFDVRKMDWLNLPTTIVGAIVWPVAGCVYGLVLWHRMERSYEEHRAENDRNGNGRGTAGPVGGL